MKFTPFGGRVNYGLLLNDERQFVLDALVNDV
jgi:hypothetical protein